MSKPKGDVRARALQNSISGVFGNSNFFISSREESEHLYTYNLRDIRCDIAGVIKVSIVANKPERCAYVIIKIRDKNPRVYNFFRMNSRRVCDIINEAKNKAYKEE